VSSTPERLAVVLESGDKRVFASAADWPGWSRSARTDEAAIEALVAYAPRYAPVARLAGFELPASIEVDVVERNEGGGGTDFGVPSRVTEADARKVSKADAERLAAIVEAAWTTFDRVAAGAPAELRKGPRGGGRDRDKMVRHVVDADAAYAREIGLKLKEPEPFDRKAVEALRGAILAVLRQPSDGSPLAGRRWTARYAAHRIAWHALDHAWELQDRSE
jgi:hypothetical protein